MEKQKDKHATLPDNIQQLLNNHVELYRRDPVAAHIWDSRQIGGDGLVKTLLLTTKGRKSGEPRYVTLQYFRPEGKYVVVGSKGGVAVHPVWYLNLMADPSCHIQVADFSSAATARTAEGEEYERLWALVSEEQTRYKHYQARTSRKIPIIVLDVPGASAR